MRSVHRIRVGVLGLDSKNIWRTAEAFSLTFVSVFGLHQKKSQLTKTRTNPAKIFLKYVKLSRLWSCQSSQTRIWGICLENKEKMWTNKSKSFEIISQNQYNYIVKSHNKKKNIVITMIVLNCLKKRLYNFWIYQTQKKQNDTKTWVLWIFSSCTWLPSIVSSTQICSVQTDKLLCKPTNMSS